MYLCEPIKGLLGQFVPIAVLLEVGNNARPYAFEFFECGRHLARSELGIFTEQGQDRGAVADVGVRAVKESNFRGGQRFRRAIVCAPPCRYRKLTINTRIGGSDITRKSIGR